MADNQPPELADESLVYTPHHRTSLQQLGFLFIRMRTKCNKSDHTVTKHMAFLPVNREFTSPAFPWTCDEQGEIISTYITL